MALSYALILPFALALVSILDKYVISKRVRNYKAFLIVIAAAQIIIAGIIASFLEWHFLSLYGAAFAVTAGLFVGIGAYSYYYLLRTEDASCIIGLSYLYPIVVALLSVIFLHETLTLLAYAGVLLTVLGAVLLSSRWPGVKTKALMPMLFVILFTGTYEFLIKIASNYVSEWHGIVLTSAGIIVAYSPMLFVKSVSKDLHSEMKNLNFALIIESIVFLEFLIVYIAMKGASATIVAAISATQPLVVLFYETLGNRFGADISKQHWKEKILPILLIVIGVALIYLKA